MIVVSASALGNMVNANFFIPATLKRREEPAQSINPLLLRRLAIILIFVLAYLYYTYFVEQRSSLVSIGMISFIGIAQLAPGFFGALFWRKSNSVAVLVGLIGGFLIWLAAFGLPQWTPTDVGQAYVFHIFSTWSPMSNIIFASLFVNTFLMVGLSIVLPMNPLEHTQAEIFFNIMNISRDRYDQSPIKTGRITFERLEKMMLRYLPEELLSETLYKRYTIMRVEAAPFAEVPGDLLSYSERLLTQIIGPVAARIVMNREIEEDSINTFDIQDIIQETKATQRLNVALREKTEILERTTAELTMANDQLQAMGSLKDDFLYTVTHELRSPLTAIRAQIEIIRDDQDMPEELQNQFLDAAISECERLTNLITTVLDIEKFESGNQQLSYQSTDLRKLADRTLENMRAWAFSEGISLEIDGPEVAYCDVDEARIHQVLMNLLSNALKYGRERISLRIHQDSDAWTICIEDDGPGVPADDVPHLFNKFYQSTDQTVKKRIGTGLGLAISYNIVRSHGGQLELSQNPPEGPTTFCITLPQKTSSL
jgi:signal transduction histidine kinase